MTDDPTSIRALPNAAAMPHLRFLQVVRTNELCRALAHFPSPRHANSERRRTVLEIGAGTGQQAKLIEDKGYSVVAIDLPSSHYRNDRVYEVTEYDGRTIPMPRGTADVVFSSNVLEHVRGIDAFLDETLRVMAKNGVAVHILPSSACRLWSIPAHYVWLAKRLVARALATLGHAANGKDSVEPGTPGSVREWLGTLFPLRHGERGVTLTEPYYYSRFWWIRKFRQHGFDVVNVDSNKLFYTMANALTDSLSMETRAKLSHILGSACHIYVLKQRQE